MELLIILVLLYFLPTLIAVNRRQHNAAAIFMLNLFLGWALIPWVVALVWAMSSPPPLVQVHVHGVPANCAPPPQKRPVIGQRAKGGQTHTPGATLALLAGGAASALAGFLAVVAFAPAPAQPRLTAAPASAAPAAGPRTWQVSVTEALPVKMFRGSVAKLD